MKNELYQIEGMSCNHCKMAVEKEVKALEGVLLAEVDLAAKTLRVEYDEQETSPTEICLAIEEAGFAGSLIP